jgi:ankyrin repeat protein
MESGGTNIESVPGKPLSDDQDPGATIPLMVDCARSNNHDVKNKDLLINDNGAGSRALSEAVLNVDIEMEEFGKTPLQKAAEDNNFEIIKSLLEHPKNLVDAQDKFGYTALHRATQQANPDKEIINLLINNGADIGVKNEFGDTPLHLATDQASPNKEVIRLLITRGADIGVKNKSGEIPRLSTADYEELFNRAISVVTAGKNILVSGLKEYLLDNFSWILFVF